MHYTGRLHCWPTLRTNVPDCRDAAAGAAEPVHGLQPGVEKGLAPTKRLQTRFVSIRPNPHAQRYGLERLKFS
jgi:hypothetical protein